MHTRDLTGWVHDHTFGQDRVRRGEVRTLVVTLLTAATMGIEITAGLAFGSMALLADGLHMASHATALGIAVFAYAYTRRFAADPRYSFGTGKVNALAGFTSALLLAVFAIGMTVESGERLVAPVTIAFDQAIAVAVVGLLVNGASVVILAGAHPHHLGHGHGHDHSHGHAHDPSHIHGPAHGRHGRADPEKASVSRGRAVDHNLRGAYLHVLADSLTSLLAIAALLAGKLLGWVWMDPAMGIVGAILIARWSWGLLRDSSHVLLDRQAPGGVREGLRRCLEADPDDRVADMHVWSVGPGIYAAAVSVVSDRERSPGHYKQGIPPDLGIVHMTLEVHRCPGSQASSR